MSRFTLTSWLALALVFGSASIHRLPAQEEEVAPIFRTPQQPAAQPTLPPPPTSAPNPLQPALPPPPPAEPESEPFLPGLVPRSERDPQPEAATLDGDSAPSPEMAPGDTPGLPLPPPDSEPARNLTTGPGFQTSYQTSQGARILTLSIPAPRGQIVDRNGAPLAQNVVAYYLGLNFPLLDDGDDAAKLTYARDLLEKANQTLEKSWSITDENLLAHYEQRRWLPLVFSRLPLNKEEKEKIEELDATGLILVPTYERVYPQREIAAHVVGFVGQRGPWPTGEIPDGETLWPTAQGVRGLEKAFDHMLTGTPGRVQIIFNSEGEKVEETVVRNPVPGHNVVLALDLEMQILADRILSEHVKRGAFVIMDVQTGDVLAMASFPSFDPNEYIPRISLERQNALVSDPAKPLIGRAFQGVYPPASTFKVVSALGMLEAGTVNEYTTFDCPKAFTIGDRIAHNWNKYDEGFMNVIGAITRSCNTWFYQGAMQTESSHITLMGKKLGYGERTGIPIPEEQTGIMPDNEWYIEKFGYRIGKGDLANLSIGQGSVESTPLQVAQGMAAVGNRTSFHHARLVLQVQDFVNSIVDAYDVSARPLFISYRHLEIVHRGLYDVVNHERGTGSRAGHPKISVSGKTGTGQWKPALNQNVAWFSGFAPSEFPVYAFSAIYEGDPGETIGGGSKAAPIVGQFFQEYLSEDQLVALQEKSDRIRIKTGDAITDTGLDTGSIFRSGPAGPTTDSVGDAPPPPAQKPKPTGGGLFRKIFGS